MQALLAATPLQSRSSASFEEATPATFELRNGRGCAPDQFCGEQLQHPYATKPSTKISQIGGVGQSTQRIVECTDRFDMVPELKKHL